MEKFVLVFSIWSGTNFENHAEAYKNDIVCHARSRYLVRAIGSQIDRGENIYIVARCMPIKEWRATYPNMQLDEAT